MCKLNFLWRIISHWLRVYIFKTHILYRILFENGKRMSFMVSFSAVLNGGHELTFTLLIYCEKTVLFLFYKGFVLVKWRVYLVDSIVFFFYLFHFTHVRRFPSALLWNFRIYLRKSFWLRALSWLHLFRLTSIIVSILFKFNKLTLHLISLLKLRINYSLRSALIDNKVWISLKKRSEVLLSVLKQIMILYFNIGNVEVIMRISKYFGLYVIIIILYLVSINVL